MRNKIIKSPFGTNQNAIVILIIDETLTSEHVSKFYELMTKWAGIKLWEIETF